MERAEKRRRMVGRMLSWVLSNRLLRPIDCRRFLRLCGVHMAPSATVYPGLNFIGRADLLTLGNGVFINANVTIGGGERIILEDGVFVGPGTSLLPTTHEIGPPSKRAGVVVAREIRIGRGTWIGANVTISGGVSIGDGCVIAAGAVVTRDCEPGAIYGGVPARIIRMIE